MNQTPLTLSMTWLNEIAFSVRLHGTERSTKFPLLFKQVEILSGCPSPRIPTSSSPLSLSYFSIFRRQVGPQQQFSAPSVSLRPDTKRDSRSSSRYEPIFGATGASLCFGTRTSDPWKCRNLVASLNSVLSRHPLRLLRVSRIPSKRCFLNNDTGKSAPVPTSHAWPDTANYGCFSLFQEFLLPRLQFFIY